MSFINTSNKIFEFSNHLQVTKQKKPLKAKTGAAGRKTYGNPLIKNDTGAAGRKSATEFNTEEEAYLAYLKQVRDTLIKNGAPQDEIDAINEKIAQAAENVTLDGDIKTEAVPEDKILGMQKKTAYIVIGAAIIILIMVFVKLSKKQ